MKTSHGKLLTVFAAILLPLAGFAQVNSGSNGSDGAFNPTANVVINMADHPDGIYHYTSVNIPAGVTVSFIPNAGNKPVVWLVQGSCSINGQVSVSAQSANVATAGLGGPGGWAGGRGGTIPSSGYGPGGGGVSPGNGYHYGGGGSFGSQGYSPSGQGVAGVIYGSPFLLPLLGGSGGGGSATGSAGGGGGGAILIASSISIDINGSIVANGGYSGNVPVYGFAGGGGSGGAIRLVAANLSGTGGIYAGGNSGSGATSSGFGRLRIDAYQNTFGGPTEGVLTQGFQPIIISAPGQGIQLAIQSLAGVAVAASPSGVLANPDVIIPAQQANPIPVVVRCTNLPLNTEISVVVHPANGPDVQAVGLNNAGTAAASTATVSLNMPRGGGIIYAKAVTGIAGGGAAIGNPADAKTRSLAETGWTADGERFVKMEITAALGGPQRVTYITPSGKRYPAN
jgi:hypothetical protein